MFSDWIDNGFACIAFAVTTCLFIGIATVGVYVYKQYREKKKRERDVW